jgi:hypothetical protein
MDSQSTRIRRLGLFLAALLIIESAGGLFIPAIYRDIPWVKSAMQSSDIVTLFLVVPMMLISLPFMLKRSFVSGVIWLGCVCYALYFNMYYMFGAAFNLLCLDYIAIAVVGTCTLVAGLRFLRPTLSSMLPAPSASAKWAAGFMIFFAAILGTLWISQWAVFAFTGKLPDIITTTGGSTHLVAVLDLSMIVSPVLLAAFWILRSHPWGRLVSAALMILCLLTCIVLIASAPMQTAAGVKDAWDLVPLWIVLGLLCLAPAMLLLRRNQ